LRRLRWRGLSCGRFGQNLTGADALLLADLKASPECAVEFLPEAAGTLTPIEYLRIMVVIFALLLLMWLVCA
jgi:hypothetical protein